MAEPPVTVTSSLATAGPGHDRLEWVDAGALGQRVADLVDEGGRFVMVVGLDERSVGSEGLAVEAVVARADGRLARLRVALPLGEPSYTSISTLVPAAHWDEREAKDLFGIVPVGHPDPRRLVLHERWPRGYHPLRKDVPGNVRPPEADRHFVPFEVHGEGVYQLPVGPIHAGIIEPGHFRFSAIGERVLHLDARLGFVHRGLEKLVEGRSFGAALPIVERACGVCTVTHAMAYSQAVETLAGPAIPRARAVGPGPARRARAPLQPRWRSRQHLRWDRLPARSLAARLAEGALAPGERRTDRSPLPDGDRRPWRLADRPRSAWPGCSARDARCNQRRAPSGDPVDPSVEGVMARFHGTGVVSTETAAALGALGVAARASGLTLDLRRDRPYAAYDELDVGLVTASAGDVAARFHVRAQEAHDSLRLVREAARRLPAGPVSAPLQATPAVGDSTLGAAEGPRGASWIWLRAGADGTIDRLRLRSASFANWPVVAAAAPGNLVPDFPLINKSFELCYACTDR